MHTGGGGGEGGIKVYPPSKMFSKLVNKNAIKHQKGVPSPKNFHNPYIPSLPKFGKKLTDPPPGFSNLVHLCMGDREMDHLLEIYLLENRYFKLIFK
jgi:hypothetical protein